MTRLTSYPQTMVISTCMTLAWHAFNLFHVEHQTPSPKHQDITRRPMALIIALTSLYCAMMSFEACIQADAPPQESIPEKSKYVHHGSCGQLYPRPNQEDRAPQPPPTGISMRKEPRRREKENRRERRSSKSSRNNPVFYDQHCLWHIYTRQIVHEK
jgi:hypothetical protein